MCVIVNGAASSIDDLAGAAGALHLEGLPGAVATGGQTRKQSTSLGSGVVGGAFRLAFRVLSDGIAVGLWGGAECSTLKQTSPETLGLPKFHPARPLSLSAVSRRDGETRL